MCASRTSQRSLFEVVRQSLSGGVIVLLLTIPAVASAAVLRVNPSSGNDANGGTNWDTDALATIEGAIGKASAGDEIWVQAGYYAPPNQGSYSAILVNKPVAIYGGFSGTETQRSQRNPRGNQATVQCPYTGGTVHGFYVNPGAVPGTVVIDGFTIDGGRALGVGYPHNAGGGIVAASGAVVIANCEFRYCYSYFGGAISISGTSSSAVIGCTFRGNDASNFGGGIDSADANITIVDCLFYENRAWEGGAIRLYFGGTVTNCTVAANNATNNGGGIYSNWQGTFTITNCIVWGNAVSGTPNEIGNDGMATATVSYSDVRGGYAGTGNINVDPYFVRFASNGDYRVQPFSPCIDAGSNAALPADVADLDGDGNVAETLPLDLAGHARVVDGNNDTTATVDLGAFEYVPGVETLRTLSVVTVPSGAGHVAGPGIDCPGTCARAYIHGSLVKLTATTDARGIFVMWDDWNTDSTYSVTLTEDQTVTATFIIPQSGPAIQVTPAEYDFGAIEPNRSSTVQIWIRNVGTEPLVLGTIEPPVAPFSLTSDPCAGQTLDIGAQCMIEVGFQPSDSDYGRMSSNVSISSNDLNHNPFVIPLHATVFRDEDEDGVSDLNEQGPTGDNASYDGNNDGTPDWQQSNVASLPQAEGSGYVTLAVPAATGHFERAYQMPLEWFAADGDYPPPPASVSFLQGLYCFRVGLEPGVTAATITMYLAAGSYPSRYYQFDDSAKDEADWYWYEFAYNGQTGATSAANIITIRYIDGQRGDYNLTEPDGEIYAQTGPAWLAGDDDDGDGIPSTRDNCPFKFNPDQKDSDGDGVGDTCDNCPNDRNKTEPGTCGCGLADADTDGDHVPDCQDGCPNDRTKTAPGPCGCGHSDGDTDNDGTADCIDGCPNDPHKTAPGVCGCGNPDTDTDGDGVPDCIDGCPNDPSKTAPGACGCGNPDTDTDGDGIPDCLDNCPNTPNPDQKDSNHDGRGDACTPDADSDGVDSVVEDGAPNSGDGNDDGTPDSEQLNVASLPNTNGDYVTLAAPEGTVLVGVGALDNPSPADTPPGAEFPAGFLSFVIHGVKQGGDVAVQIILHVPPETAVNSYWKYGPTPDDPTPHWYEFMFDGTTGAEIAGNVITLHFVDGARGDADLTANGVIGDPGAPAVYTAPGDNTGQDIPAVPACCGAGACGPGAVGYVPVTLLGICGLKLRRRRPAA
jgi:hypothetical protein